MARSSSLAARSLGVVGDVGGLDPVGAGGVDAEDEQFLLGVVDELAGLFGGGLGVGGEGQGGEATSRGTAAERSFMLPR